jgi:F-type H+-transporting ATPase subunit a
MPETLAFTRLLNHLFGGAVAAVLQALGVHPANLPLPSTIPFAMELLVAGGLIAFFALVRLTLSVEKPNPAQQIAEMIHEFTGSRASRSSAMGTSASRPSLPAFFLFVVINNLLGLIPGIVTPTSQPAVPLGIAVLTFLYYNFHGVRELGVVGYLKHLPVRCGGSRRCCFQSRSSRTARASCRSPSVFTPTCWPAIW